MRSLSLVTAVAPGAAEHLPQTATNVAAAVTYLRGHGVEVDWTIVVDGHGRLPRFRSAENVRVLRTAAPAGVAACRNLALAASSGQWLLPLDADDLVAAPAVLEVLPPASGSAAAWLVGNHGDVDTRTIASAITDPVACAPGQLGDLWQRGWPFDAGSVLLRRDAVLAVGGWPALPAGEETALLLRLAEEYPGVCVPQLLGYRRRWSGARSHGPGWNDDLARSMWLTAASVNAGRALRHPSRGAVHPPTGRR